MSKAVIKVEQTRSPIRRHHSQRETLIGLGLNKIGRIAEVPDTPSSRGMIAKVQHLVRVHEPPEVSEIECFAEQVRAASSEGGMKREAMTDAIRTRFQWLDLLAEKSPVVARIDLKRGEPDAIYKAEGEKLGENKDAFNFANSEHDNVVIVQTIDRLSERGAPDRTIRKLVLDLTGRTSNTYGTFCELSAYSFLLKGNHDFDIQASMTGADILNPNGSDLDGRLRLPEVVLFDAKAFGFNEHLVNLLTERLSAEFDPEIVEAHESWDVPVALLSDLLGKDYRQLKDELTSNRQAKRGTIRFVLRPPAKVRMTFREIDLALLAQENPDYAFRYAKQFARQKPFFLFFVIHPWLSGSLHQNFIGSVDTFTRSFAYRTFTHFRADHRAVFDITMGEASRLLSGIVFINAWTGQPPPPPPQYRCFLNPFAKNKPAQSSIQTFIAPYGEAMAIVEFESEGPTDRSA